MKSKINKINNRYTKILTGKIVILNIIYRQKIIKNNH